MEKKILPAKSSSTLLQLESSLLASSPVPTASPGAAIFSSHCLRQALSQTYLLPNVYCPPTIDTDLAQLQNFPVIIGLLLSLYFPISSQLCPGLIHGTIHAPNGHGQTLAGCQDRGTEVAQKPTSKKNDQVSQKAIDRQTDRTTQPKDSRWLPEEEYLHVTERTGGGHQAEEASGAVGA